jgi:hypothetical protein
MPHPDEGLLYDLGIWGSVGGLGIVAANYQDVGEGRVGPLHPVTGLSVDVVGRERVSVSQAYSPPSSHATTYIEQTRVLCRATKVIRIEEWNGYHGYQVIYSITTYP